MTNFRVAFVDVYVLRSAAHGLDCLVLRRSATARCTGAWEAVHGGIDAGESPLEAAVRELKEETGLAVSRLYNLSRTETFYRHRVDEVAFIPVFAAFVGDATVRLSPEHDRFEWLPLADAGARLAWPRERRALEDIQAMLGGGDAGPLEDVLRVC